MFNHFIQQLRIKLAGGSVDNLFAAFLRQQAKLDTLAEHLLTDASSKAARASELSKAAADRFAEAGRARAASQKLYEFTK